jgi:hypothetical protein
MAFGTLIDKARRYSRGIAGLRSDDVILVSYPKSGNTWVRFFFCNLISKIEWEGKEVDFETVDKTLPELAVDDLSLAWPFQSLPRIVKTHNPFWFPFRGKRAIYVIRDPRDVMVSHYHFVTGKRAARWEGEFKDFIRHPKYGLENWFRHVKSWQGKWTVMVRYEDLLMDDVAEFRRILSTMERQVEEPVLAEVVEKSRFGNLKKVVETAGHSKRGDFKEGFNFMRKGQSKDWVDKFSQEDLALYKSLVERTGIRYYEPE